MKTHKRILKEAQIVLKALAHARDDDGNRLNVCNLEMYITDADTDQVLELEIGVDENGELVVDCEFCKKRRVFSADLKTH